MQIKNEKSKCMIEFNGFNHEAIKVGSRIETRCGIIAKNISLSAPNFKMVEISSNDMTCPSCKAAGDILEDVKE